MIRIRDGIEPCCLGLAVEIDTDKSDVEVLAACTCGSNGKKRLAEIDRQIADLRETRKELKALFERRKRHFSRAD